MWGVTDDELAVVSNTSAGVSAVLRGLALRPGAEIVLTDHAYGAMAMAARDQEHRERRFSKTIPCRRSGASTSRDWRALKPARPYDIEHTIRPVVRAGRPRSRSRRPIRTRSPAHRRAPRPPAVHAAALTDPGVARRQIGDLTGAGVDLSRAPPDTATAKPTPSPNSASSDASPAISRGRRCPRPSPGHIPRDRTPQRRSQRADRVGTHRSPDRRPVRRGPRPRRGTGHLSRRGQPQQRSLGAQPLRRHRRRRRVIGLARSRSISRRWP